MTIDSNILILYLKGERNIITTLDEWREEHETLFVSSVSFCEVLSYPTIEPGEISEALDYLNSFISIPFDNILGETAAFLRRLYRLSLPDAAIAASAIKYDVTLVTRDQDFCRIKEMQLVEI